MTSPYIPFHSGRFVKPTQEQQLQACGLKEEKDDYLFAPTPSFTMIPYPKKGYWLAEHPEQPQTYRSFLRSKYPRLTIKRRKLYLLPLGSFKESLAPSLNGLVEFAKAFFYGMEVILLDPLPVLSTEEKKGKQKSSCQYVYFGEAKAKNVRVSSRKQEMVQLLTTEIMNVLVSYIPAEGYYLIGLTMYDLYPKESWNFVFGQASPHDRVGVFSFARYSPSFGSSTETSLSKVEMSLLFYRSLQTMVHEISHMFGVDHCLYFDCVMNGANCLEESDEQSLFLCPIDLRKLAHLLKFSVLDRYYALQTFFNKYQTLGYSFEREIKWLTIRIRELCPTKKMKEIFTEEQILLI